MTIQEAIVQIDTVPPAWGMDRDNAFLRRRYPSLFAHPSLKRDTVLRARRRVRQQIKRVEAMSGGGEAGGWARIIGLWYWEAIANILDAALITGSDQLPQISLADFATPGRDIHGWDVEVFGEAILQRAIEQSIVLDD